jgi:lipid-A-disaccharide synthase
MSSRKKKIFIVAGEASGDIYGALVARELALLDNVEIQGWGGAEMTAAGVGVTQHYRDLAYMGLYEVIVNLKKITGNLNRCWKEIDAYNPDALILVDFPGFNMRIAKKAHKKGINTFQFVAPKPKTPLLTVSPEVCKE